VVQLFSGRHGIWLHTAGALSLEVFEGHFPDCGILYPLQSFKRDRPVSLKDTPFLVEGSTQEIEESIVELAAAISENIQRTDSPTRMVVHLAAVFANNFTNHMVHVAQQILEDHKVDRKILDPILKETFARIAEVRAGESQTGPAKRGDRETMEKHLELLKRYPEWQNLYTFISRDISSYEDPETKKH
jgi:predicted short-subunit dehydrogenase-like oxidoreductase (DUF2520 family)